MLRYTEKFNKLTYTIDLKAWSFGLRGRKWIIEKNKVK